MTEVVSERPLMDESALDVLLQELSTGIPEEIASLLNDRFLHDEMLKYLDGISSIESKEYLSSVPPTPAFDGGTVVDSRTLVQDIAELESAERSIDTTLKNLIVKSHGSIIENKNVLNQATTLFQVDFNDSLKSVWRLFNEDNLNDYGEDDEADLHELEADLEKQENKNTFRSAVSRIKSTEIKDETHHKNLSIVLENMDKILSILELPTLTGACIKAGYYSEALEISSYTRRLAIRFPNNDMIKGVEKGISEEMSYMLTGLIRLLRTNLKQSSLIKTLSYLKRVPPFSQSSDTEGQLKRILLHARYQFIKSELESLVPLKESELWEKFLKRSIEVIREHCFGSIMTYKNVFPDIDDIEQGKVTINLEKRIQKIVEHVAEENIVKESDQVIEKSVEGDKAIGSEGDPEENQSQEAEEKGKVDEGKDAIDSQEREDPEDSTQSVEVENESSKKTEDEGEGKVEANEEKVEEIQESDKSPEVPAPTTTVYDDESVVLMNNGKDRKPSNLLLYEFVEQVVELLLPVLDSSLTNIPQVSIRDGLYLQLIYCAKSLARIDENFGDLMTVLFLNHKVGDEFLIDRDSWISSIEKQKKLASSLSRH